MRHKERNTVEQGSTANSINKSIYTNLTTHGNEEEDVIFWLKLVKLMSYLPT